MKKINNFKKSLRITAIVVIAIAAFLCGAIAYTNSGAQAEDTKSAEVSVTEAQSAYDKAVKAVSSLKDDASASDQEKAYTALQKAGKALLEEKESALKAASSDEDKKSIQSEIDELNDKLDETEKTLASLDESESKETAVKTDSSKKDSSKSEAKATEKADSKASSSKASSSKSTASKTSSSKTTSSKAQSSKADSSSSTKSTSQKGCKVVHHDATGHYETVTVKDAYDEQVVDQKEWNEEVLAEPYHVVCNGCGQKFNTWEEYEAHAAAADALEDPDDPSTWTQCSGSYHTEEATYHNIIHPATYKTVHHDAVTQQKWVQDKAAYDETVCQ